MILIFENSYIYTKQHAIIRSIVLFYITFIHTIQYIQKYTDLHKRTCMEITSNTLFHQICGKITIY